MKGIIFLMLFTTSAFACLRPKAAFPQKYFACESDSDCVVYREACRSCGYVWSVNKQHLEKLSEVDNRWRSEDKCVRTCEACDTKKVQTFCKLNVCQQRTI